MKSLNPNADGARRSQRIQRQVEESDDQDDSEEEGSSEGNSSDDEGEGNVNGQEMEGSDGEGDDGEQNDEEEEEGGDDDGDDDDGQEEANEKGATKAKPGGESSSSTPNKGAKVSSAKADTSKSSLVASSLHYTVDELVQNAIMYLLLQHNKKTPIKRADIIKHAMNGQIKSFSEVMDKIQVIFEERFGIDLVGVEPKARAGGFPSYILVSKYQMSATQSAINATPEQEMKSTILLILLALTFMLSRPIEEEIIWKVLTDLQLTSVCKKKDDLRTFLKREYVSTLFLKVEENKETDSINVKYDWGLRAKKEFSKYWVLKFVTRLFPEKKPYDFTVQYNIVLDEEKDIVEADRAEMEANEFDDDDEEDGPSQKITFHGDGTRELEFLDGTAKSPSRMMDSLSLQNSAPGTPAIPEPMDVDEGNAGQAEGGEEEDQEVQSGSESESGSGSGSGSGSDNAMRGSERSDSSSTSESESD